MLVERNRLGTAAVAEVAYASKDLNSDEARVGCRLLIVVDTLLQSRVNNAEC